MINNTQIGLIIPPLSGSDIELGGALSFQALYLVVIDSYFRRNTGAMGGSFYISSYNKKISVFFRNNIFQENYGYYGSSVGFGSKIDNLLAYFVNNSFIENMARGILKNNNLNKIL